MGKRLGLILLAVAVLAGGGYSISRAVTRTPKAFFDSGKKNFDQKKYSDAAIQFLNALRKDPRHRDSRFFLALSYFNEHDIGAAAKELRTLLEYYPDDVPANLQLAEILLGAGQSKPDYYHQAQELAQKVLSKEPQNAAALIVLGNASAGLQDYNSADLFEKAINVDPQNIAAFISLGTAQALQKNFPEAEKAFLKAREVNPKDKTAIMSLANYYRATGDAAKAETIFKEGLSLYPGDRAVYLASATFYFRTGRMDDGEKVLRDAQASNPSDPFPTLTLASLYEAQNRAPDARKLLLELKPKFPNNVPVDAKLAGNLMQDRPKDAQPVIDEILKNEPKNPVGYVLLGELQYRTRQFDAAEATLGKDPALNSQFPQPHFLLGNIAALKGQLDQAQDHYQKALAINGQYMPARMASAENYLSKGNVADSREEVRKVLAAQPGNEPARLLSAKLDMAARN